MARWLFTDPVTSESWRVPWNPDSMTSPYRKVGVESLPESAVDTRIRAMVTEQPVEWTFEGAMKGWTHYDTLLEGGRKPNPIVITDHLGRNITVLLTQLELTDKRSRVTHEKWKYVVRGQVLDVDWPWTS